MSHDLGVGFPWTEVKNGEARWPAMLALFGVALLQFALPVNWTLKPVWVPALCLTLLAIPTVVTHRVGSHDWNRIFGHLLSAAVTLFTVTSLVLLVETIPNHAESAGAMLRGGGCLWLSNILVFASWYWRLDAGGPHCRERRECHTDGAFLFPQMTMTPDQRDDTGFADWSPGFVDYLFLAFNTSTALSPADTAVLSGWAKLMMMVQASISFTVIVLVVARAINVM